MILRTVLVTAIACIASASLPAQATQAVAPPPGDALASSAYQRDALGIAPVWNGLAVVRGSERSRVANLNFFWPRRLLARSGGTTHGARARRRRTSIGAQPATSRYLVPARR